MSERDINKYGASVVRANVAAGTRYWKVIEAYHLSGQQNKGNHHVFIDMLNADGTRRNGAHCNLYFGEHADHHALLTIDKPPNEPGTNAPMFRGNFYDVDGADMPSDKAIHFNSEWPDEEAGNTNGHHSFMVIFKETVAAGGGITTGSIRGAVANGAGRTVSLSGNGVSVTGPISADGNFGFDNVAPGSYVVAVVGTSVSAPVTVQSGQQAHLSLVVPSGGDDVAALKQQIAALQAQVSQLQQERDRYKAALGQIKQIVQSSGI